MTKNTALDNKNEQLLKLVERGKWDSAQLFLLANKNFAYIDAVNNNGNTALMSTLSAYLGYGEKDAIPKAKCLELMQILIETGSNVRICNKEGEEPLFLAIEKSDFEVFQLLMGSKAIMALNKEHLGEVTDRQNYTLLMRALYKHNKKITQLIIPRVELNNIVTAGWQENIVWTMSYSMALDDIFELNERDKVIKWIVTSPKVDINHQAKDGKTPLIVAAEGAKRDLVEILLEQKNIDLSKRDEDLCNVLHSTALQFAKRTDEKAILNLVAISKQVLKTSLSQSLASFERIGDFMLLLNQKDKEGRTPLYYLERGLQIMKKNQVGKFEQEQVGKIIETIKEITKEFKECDLLADGYARKMKKNHNYLAYDLHKSIAGGLLLSKVSELEIFNEPSGKITGMVREGPSSSVRPPSATRLAHSNRNDYQHSYGANL